MLGQAQDIPFGHRISDEVLLQDLLLLEDLHGVYPGIRLLLHQVHRPEAALPEPLNYVEVLQVDALHLIHVLYLNRLLLEGRCLPQLRISSVSLLV